MIYSNTLKTLTLLSIEEMLHVGKQAFQFNLEHVPHNGQRIVLDKQQRRGVAQGSSRSYVIVSSEFLEIH